MDKETMKRIARAQGCSSLCFREHTRKNGEKVVYVIVYINRSKGFSLGKLSDVSRWSEEGLRDAIAAKLAPRKAKPPLLSMDDIDDILFEQGYVIAVQTQSLKSDASEYIYARCCNVRAYIGKFNDLASMNREELVQLIEAKFAAREESIARQRRH